MIQDRRHYTSLSAQNQLDQSRARMVKKLRLLKAAAFQHFWSWAGVAQQACRGRLRRDDGGRKQFWVRRSAQQFQCSMAVLELLARATEAWVVAAGNEHLVNRSSRIVDGVSRRCTAGKPVRIGRSNLHVHLQSESA